MQFHPDRDLRLQGRQPVIHPVAHIHNVLRRHARHAQREGVHSVMAHDQARIFLRVAVHMDKIDEVQQLPAHAHGQACNLIHRVIAIGALDQHAPVRSGQRTAIGDRIRRGQRADQRRRRHVEVCGQRRERLHVDDLVRNGLHAHIRDTRHGQQFSAQKARQFIDFAVVEPLRRHRKIDAVHIPETVIHEGPPGPARQARIAHPVAQLRPDLRQRITVISVLHIHRDPA